MAATIFDKVSLFIRQGDTTFEEDSLSVDARRSLLGIPDEITIPFSGTSVTATWDHDKYARFEVHLTKTSGTSTTIVATLAGLTSGTYLSYDNYYGAPTGALGGTATGAVWYMGAIGGAVIQLDTIVQCKVNGRPRTFQGRCWNPTSGYSEQVQGSHTNVTEAVSGITLTFDGSIEGELQIVGHHGATSVIPVGDSITLGYPDNVGGWRATLFAAHPLLWSVGTQTDGTGINRSKKHEGVGGRNSADILAGISSWYAAWPADIVLLQIGTNDLTGYPTPLLTTAQYASNVVGAINAVKAIKPHVKVFLGKLPYTKLGIYPPSAIDAYRSALSAAVAGMTNLVEVDFPQMPDANFADALHPSAAGYASMAATWSAALTAAGY